MSGGSAFRLAARSWDRAPFPYADDRVGFVRECFRWRDGQGPAPYQERILAALDDHDRVCIRGPHGLGKSATDAWVILHWALTMEAAGTDWKMPTTASSWHQLAFYLWPEVHKWARMLRWDKVGRPAFDRNELLKLRLRLGYGEAFAITSDNPASIEGAHADALLYLFDEAKAIIPDVWDAVEGAFAGAGGDSGLVAKWLANSTPGEPVGRFHDIQVGKPGYADWHTIHVTVDEAIAAGRISPRWVEDRRRQWGETSPQFQNRVLGNFAEQDAYAVIPLRWVELAQERWIAGHEVDDEGRIGEWLDLPHLTNVGVDVARGGDARTVIAPRHGWTFPELRVYEKQSTMVTANLTARAIGGLTGVWATVDTDGLGAGVTDRLRELDVDVVAFHGAARTDYTDRTGELTFGNARAAAWWNLRECLDPESGEPVALPPDDELLGELVAPKWRTGAGGRIFLEAKDDVEKRIGRSLDKADAVVMAAWKQRPPVVDLSGYDRNRGPVGYTDDLLDVGF